MEPDYKQTEVTYKFYLPDNQDELELFQKSNHFHFALWEIHDKCRQVWKYEDSPSEGRLKLAEEIGDIIAEAGGIE